MYSATGSVTHSLNSSFDFALSAAVMEKPGNVDVSLGNFKTTTLAGDLTVPGRKR